MPSMSRTNATHVEENEAGTEWSEELGGYKVSFVQVAVDADLTPLLAGLPGDRCPCPHWGNVLEGRIWFRFGDRTEEYAAGDAFYTPAGHLSGADAGAQFVIFSPAGPMAEVEAHMTRRAAELQGA